jgi:hypothetical protein
LIRKCDKNTISIFHSIVPDEEDVGDLGDAGITETDKIERGEIIGNSDDEESGGSGARVRQRAM